MCVVGCVCLCLCVGVGVGESVCVFVNKVSDHLSEAPLGHPF